jgi:8-oxo-dGTP pyrophosphatase MutT (NUDIX family)
MQKSHAAGGVIVNLKGEIALIKNGPTFWGFPKGHMDVGEDALSAAVREIHEETGLHEIALLKDLGSYERMGGMGMKESKQIHMYLFSTKEEVLAPIDPSNPEARWVSAGEVAQTLTNEIDRNFFVSIIPHLPKRD